MIIVRTYNENRSQNGFHFSVSRQKNDLDNFTLMLQLRIRLNFPPQIWKNSEKQKKGDKRKF